MKVRREALPVPGFRAAGLNAGIKDRDPDLALIVSDTLASAAAVFTQSTVVGAPVEVSRERMRRGQARGVVVNSGCSNVAMGARGVRDAKAMSRLAARAVGCDEDQMLVASTGVIGEPLPMDAIRSGVPRAAEALAVEGWMEAAEAIRTTDTHAKVASARLRLGGRTITLQGIAKGSGMIEPNMATMLSFLATDAKIAPKTLQAMLKRVADRTYNCLSIDAEGSTSDTVVLLANGAAGGAALRGDDAAKFEAALLAVCEDLVRQLARDGEGATKLLLVEVEGAKNADQARRAVRRIGNSMLVKTAVFGGDPNWGRIMQALGHGQIAWHPEKTRVKVGGVTVFAKGRSAGPAARKRAEKAHEKDELRIEVDLALGRHASRLFTCDLTYDYVKINAEYTT
ncbi:MAG: bifunctional ornithine acetyltransferase/N-acetylglutamate synthase [Deltaproteobacteria bacterium]|nr:bifunctional ornithine acetyltransferase/N-acetylglutamate synthase [Deltaproteobacteria bacterium]